MKVFLKSLIVLALFLSLAGCEQLAGLIKPPQLLADQTSQALPTRLVLDQGTQTPGTQRPEELTITPNPKAPSIWIANDEDRLIFRIDPLQNSIVATIQVSGRPQNLVTTDSQVWVIEAVDDKRSNILKIDIPTNRVTASIPIIYGAVRSIAAGAGAVWVGIAEPASMEQKDKSIEYTQKGGVIRIDPQSNQVTDYFKTGAVSSDLQFHNNTLWVLEWLYMLTRFDRLDLSARKMIPVPRAVESSDYIHQFASFSINRYGIWAINLDLKSPYAYKVDPEDGRVLSSIKIGREDVEGDYPMDVAATDDAVWVAMQNGTVVQLHPQTGEPMTYIQAGSNLNKLFLEAGRVWTYSRTDAMLYQVDPTSGHMTISLQVGSKPRPTPTPTVTPMPTPIGETWSPCPETYVSHLKAGINAMVSVDPPLPNRVRKEPNKVSQITGFLQPGEVVEIVTGPSCTDQWIWWNVRSNQSGISGWTSEGDGIDYWLVPSP